MSGLAAILTHDAEPADRSSVEQMISAMACRGPDGRGVRTDGPVGMGHLLLCTAPESVGEQQPLVRGDLALIGDCRIDNREELQRSLATSPADVHAPDATLILRAYERWGESCVESLLGDFAFIVWDGRERRLFCARDRFGIKPLYYHAGDAVFAAASEIKALLALPRVPRRLDEQLIADHLGGRFDDPATTGWTEIRRLPAAHTMVVHADGRVRLRCYWALDPRREIELENDAAYAERLRSLFLAAVQRRMRSRGPVGAALSGGLDSTAVACGAERLRSERGQDAVHTFSLVFPSLPAVDERRWIDSALQDRHFVAHFINGDELDPFEAFEERLRRQDGFLYAPNLYMDEAIFGAARRNGVGVFLTGYDGDSTLSHGLLYPRELMLDGRVLAAWRETRALAHRHGRSTWRQARRLSVVHFDAGLAGRANRVAYRLRRRPPTVVSDPWNQFGIVRPAFAQRLGLAQRDTGHGSHPAHLLRREREAHHRRLTWPAQVHLLEALDRAAAAHGVEPRYPFFDVPLMEFCLAMPPHQKLRDGWTRWVMRRAMDGILPAAVRWRPDKSNLSPVLAQALRRSGGASWQALFAAPGPIGEYVERADLRGRWDQFVAAPAPNDVMAIWLTLALGRGLQVIDAAGWGDGAHAGCGDTAGAPTQSRVSTC